MAESKEEKKRRVTGREQPRGFNNLSEEEKERKLALIEQAERAGGSGGKKSGFLQQSGQQFVLPAQEIPAISQQQQLERQQEDLQQIQKDEFLPTAEETGVFEERPESVELGLTEEQQQTVPSLFTPAEPLQKLFGIPDNKIKKAIDPDGDFEIEDLIGNPETARQKLLQEIQREELEKGLTANQKLGSKLEPFLGDLKFFDFDASAYVDQWVRMPTREVETIVETIGEVESTVSSMTDSAAQGEIGNPGEVLRDIAKYEEELAIAEARIKKLILVSDELKANPENINQIEAKILSARETIFEAKQRAAEGALITPTNEALYFKLQNLRE